MRAVTLQPICYPFVHVHQPWDPGSYIQTIWNFTLLLVHPAFAMKSRPPALTEVSEEYTAPIVRSEE
jgi:hypothetical protein